jgi:hypothetical protein
MQTHANALPPALERAGEPRWRQAISRSAHGRRDVGEFDQRGFGPDADPPYDHRGLVVAASAWLAFYVIAVMHDFIASGY